MKDTRQIETLLRGAEGVYTPEELAERIAAGRPLRVKLGMDPTAPDLHLGHTVVLRKLRQFQDFGHKAVLIIGDYTARIGDPSGRSRTRPVLSPDEIEANARTYLDQAGKILELSPDKFEVRHNSEWLAPMDLADVLRLMGRMTVARMLERDTFAKRRAEGKEIYLHELLYPLMQAWDSVQIESDVELGGTDQTFNNLCGRDIQRDVGQPPQIVLVMPILVGIYGNEKMSKSLGNYVGVTDPPSDMFGKIMRVPDDLMANYFELLTDVPHDDIRRLTDPKQCNPRDTKERLAKAIITQYHSAEAAETAAGEFRRVFGGRSAGGMELVTEGRLPDNIPEAAVPADKLADGRIVPVDLIVACLKEKSRGEARRLVAERGIRLNGQVIEDGFTPIPIKTGDVLQRGKRKFVRLIVPEG